MNYIIEAILVGIYTCFIYLLFSHFIKNFFLLLLVVGFFKHFLGSSLGLWTWYCNNGAACVKVLSQQNKYEANTQNIIRDSFYESFAFLFLGIIVRHILTNIYLFFSIGVILHIISEKILLHNIFCEKTCDKIKTN